MCLYFEPPTLYPDQNQNARTPTQPTMEEPQATTSTWSRFPPLKINVQIPRQLRDRIEVHFQEEKEECAPSPPRQLPKGSQTPIPEVSIEDLEPFPAFREETEIEAVTPCFVPPAGSHHLDHLAPASASATTSPSSSTPPQTQDQADPDRRQPEQDRDHRHDHHHATPDGRVHGLEVWKWKHIHDALRDESLAVQAMKQLQSELQQAVDADAAADVVEGACSWKLEVEG
jgi:hypothetical protein